MNNDNRAFLYGGSFNPPTKSHLAIINCLLERFNKEVWLLPNGDDYLKKDLVSFSQRVAMLKLMFNDPRVKILDLEQGVPFRGTYYSLRKLNHPIFVMGADSLVNILTWINFETLIKENNFLIFGRGVIDFDQIMNNSEILKKYHCHFHFCECVVPAYSSSLFRETNNKGAVTEEVYQYILNNNLYQLEKR